MGRVCWGMGTGWIYLTLAIPVPSVWVAGYLPGWWQVFDQSFNHEDSWSSRIDFAFHFHNTSLDSMNALKFKYFIYSLLTTCLLTISFFLSPSTPPWPIKTLAHDSRYRFAGVPQGYPWQSLILGSYRDDIHNIICTLMLNFILADTYIVNIFKIHSHFLPIIKGEFILNLNQIYSGYYWPHSSKGL